MRRLLEVLALNESLGATLAFALQASLCSLVALWLAMVLQLDAPYWAGSTVLITAQASRSQSLLKGLNRLLGTVIGLCASLVIIALFPQGWWSFALAVSTWLALCTFFSCLFRALQSYAAALAGYTAVIVVTESFGHPLDVFTTALSRGSAIFLGVILYVIMTLVLTPARGNLGLKRDFADILAIIAAAAKTLSPGKADADACARLMVRIQAFDAAIEEAATDGRWRRGTKAAMRRATLGLADALVLSWALVRKSKDAQTPSPAPIGALNEALGQAKAGLTLLETGRKPVALGSVRRTLHRDLPGALLAAVRTFVGVMAAFAFWIETRWPTGAAFIEISGILFTLFAARPAPIAAGRSFTIGTVGTLVIALVLEFSVIPRLEGFSELSLALFPMLFIGAFGVKSATLSPYTAAVPFLFVQTLDVTNQMNYDPQGLFNSAFAIFAACCLAVVGFELIPPLSNKRQAIFLKRRLLAAAVLAVPSGKKRRNERRVRFYDRLGSLLTTMPADERAREFERASSLALRLWETSRSNAP